MFLVSCMCVRSALACVTLARAACSILPGLDYGTLARLGPVGALLKNKLKDGTYRYRSGGT